MKTTFDINDILYKTINVAAITTTISGKVYRGKKPLNSELQDIVIVPLTDYNGNPVINDAVFFINCYCKNFANGTFDIAKLRATANAVITVIEAYSNATNYYVFEIASQTIFNDNDQKTMAYVSIKINCFIEKE